MSQPLNSAYLASFDASALLDELTVFDNEIWTDHVNQADYQNGWDAIPLRCAAAHLNSHPILQLYNLEGHDDWADLPLLAQCPAIKHIIDWLQCPVHSVRLMRLHTDAHIKPHRDYELSVEHQQARLHVPIQTSDNLSFWVNGQLLPMKAGELWYINADQTHEVLNQAKQARINLVIDCEANDWLLNKITAAQTPAAV